MDTLTAYLNALEAALPEWPKPEAREALISAAKAHHGRAWEQRVASDLAALRGAKHRADNEEVVTVERIERIAEERTIPARLNNR